MYLRLAALLCLCAFAASQLVGGWEKVNVDDPDIVSTAHIIAREISHRLSNKYHQNIVRIVGARRQVVNGFNYEITVNLGSSTCKKDEVEYDDQDDCDLQRDERLHRQCFGVLWKPSTGSNKFRNYGCIAVKAEFE